jgi:mono/diheme cytochrome c family protein
MRYAYTLAALLAVTLVALPNPPVCHQPVYANKVVTAVAVPVAAAIPLYGAGYVGTASTDDETKELLRQLLAEIKSLRSDLAGNTVGIQGDEDAVAVVQKAVQTKCASCHTGATARKDFKLMTEDGKFIELNGLSRKAVLDRIDGKGGAIMPPPPGSLTPAEKAAFKAAFADKPAIPAGKK